MFGLDWSRRARVPRQYSPELHSRQGHIAQTRTRHDIFHQR